MWYQGEEAMPPIVKACYANLKKHARQHPIVLLTDKNFRQFTDNQPLWDNDIYKFVEEKKITLTQLADFARLFLLYTYGGFWIDSTVWMNKDPDELAKGLGFVSGRRLGVDNSNVVEGKWTTYFIGSAKGNPLMKFMYELMLAHVRREGRFIDYFIIDYSFVVAYNHLPYVKAMTDKIPPMPHKFVLLLGMINQAFNQDTYDKLCAEVPLSKLSYKGNLRKQTPDGKPTYYAHFIESA